MAEPVASELQYLRNKKAPDHLSGGQRTMNTHNLYQDPSQLVLVALSARDEHFHRNKNAGDLARFLDFSQLA